MSGLVPALLAAGLAGAAGCGAPLRLREASPTSTRVACPRAAFAVRVPPTTPATAAAVGLLQVSPGFFKAGGAAETVWQLRMAARRCQWEAARDFWGRARQATALIWVDCDGRVAVASARHPELSEALRARAQAATVLADSGFGSGFESTPVDPLLETVWVEYEAFTRRQPFLYDDLTMALGDSSAAGDARLDDTLRALEARDGGFWLVRRQRHSHWGEFVFLDRRQRIVAIATYRIGE